MFFLALNGCDHWAMKEIEMEKACISREKGSCPLLSEQNEIFTFIFSAQHRQRQPLSIEALPNAGRREVKRYRPNAFHKKNVTNQWDVSAKENERERKKPHGNINKSFTTGFFVFDLVRRTRYSIKLITRKPCVPTTVCRKITKSHEYFLVWHSLRRLEKDWNQIESKSLEKFEFMKRQQRSEVEW